MLSIRRYQATYASLRKAEGDRGGHVIGHTASGAPIYAASHHSYSKLIDEARGKPGVSSKGIREAHPRYNKQDHLDAAEAHQREASDYGGDDKKHAHMLAQAHISAGMTMANRAKHLESKLSPG